MHTDGEILALDMSGANPLGSNGIQGSIRFRIPEVVLLDVTSLPRIRVSLRATGWSYSETGRPPPHHLNIRISLWS